MKNCTKHFIERWVERIVEITTLNEMNDYIRDNKDLIIQHANKTLEFAQFLYRGQIGDNITRNYYIEDDIVFVLNTSNDAMITVYKVDLGFTPELNSTVRKGLIMEIVRLREEKENSDFKILEELEDKQHQVSKLDDEIKLVEQQLKNLKKQREFVDEEVKQIKNKSFNIGLELKKFTMMLVNSKEYKKDLLNMK